MRVLWATCGLAVAASALTGVLIGVYLDGVDDKKADTPASTWLTNRPQTASSTTTPSTSTTQDQVSTQPTTTTTSRKRTTTAAPPPPVEDGGGTTTTTQTTTPPPTTTSTTTAAWPCSPLNPLPPPSCDKR
ncbi:hypothetical protein [Saccharothrix coeruleofusca]|uniref:Uncharacterized protein n=1 Tax=Saccharothrix coeruleofusca TaxID=33919 RepID=A0A918AJD7_9PSEU|nr:hypothetical protein [Saccharothrix coeruleofusca]MBP2338250.1 hypothetical protein [Saccharothrix coeruleofusca]GGP49706.1 hypothetical protein GCM10010185_22350 [Saccharothrix coeruleofusca]